jgi:phosphohistidine swiveling domain-containing protein
MLLALDIGNTEISVGLFLGDRLDADWRLTTATARTPDEWAAMLTAYFAHSGRSTDELKAAVLASVVPQVAAELAEGIRKACGVTPVEVGPTSSLAITLDVDEPMTVGADRVVNTLAALTLYGRDTIVVDFGTATTFDCITGDGRFIGGVIAPGQTPGDGARSARARDRPADGSLHPVGCRARHGRRGDGAARADQGRVADAPRPLCGSDGRIGAAHRPVGAGDRGGGAQAHPGGVARRRRTTRAPLVGTQGDMEGAP